MAEAVAVERKTEHAPSSSPRWFRRTPASLGLMVAVAAAVYAAYSLVRLWRFRASTYDLVIFDQAIRSYSRLDPPIAMVKGVHNGFGPDFSILGDHFSPILAVLAPFYRLHDGPETLLVAQAVLFALAIVPIWVYTARRAGPRAAYCAAGAYALSWPVAEALAFDFHEVAFVPLLSALMVERHDAGRRRQAALAAFGLLLTKEDMGLLLVGFALYLATRRGERRQAAGYAAVGLAATWVSSKVLIAAFGGDNDYYWAYGSLGRDMPDAALHLLTHPWDGLIALGTPPMKLTTLAVLLLPLLLLPLASPLSLTAVPLLAERMLADRFANWWEPKYHYNAFLIAVLVLASVDGALRLHRLLAPRLRGLPERLRRTRAAVTAAMAVVTAATLATVPFFALGDLARPSFYAQDDRARAAARAAALVPDGALVESANSVGPALSGRTRVLLWDREPRRAPWVVADVGRWAFPFRDLGEQRRRVESLRAQGYREVFQGSGYVVLHRNVPDPW
ncbi:DUF2079 domain-containing protein [Spirillospora sp. NPDC127200]